MESTSLGSYMPEMMVIKIKKVIDALSDPENPRGFDNPDDFAVFFHEWLHYLHNISTLLGVSCLNCVVGTWHIFRETFKDGYPCGSTLNSTANNDLLNKFYIALSSFRSRKNSDLWSDINKNEKDFSIKNIELLKDVAIGDEGIHFLRIGFYINNENHRGKVYSLDVGTHEILESIAWQLEQMLLRRLKEKLKSSSDSKPPFIPYRIGEYVIKENSRFNLSEEDVIACLLYSIQSTDPAYMLYNLLLELKSHDFRSLHDVLANRVKEILIKNDGFLKTSFNMHKEAFLVDDPIAKGLLGIIDLFEKNIDRRKKSPFFEMELIDGVVGDYGNYNNIINDYGGCLVIQERDGDEDVLGRDLMYSFDKHQYNEHWQIFHAAFHYLKLYLRRPSGEVFFVGHDKLNPSNYYKCPFYTMCSLKLREKEPHICRTKPWEAESWYKDSIEDMCWYGFAVRQTRPPA